MSEALKDAEDALTETWKELKGTRAEFIEVVDSWIAAIATQRKKLAAERAKLDRKVAAAKAKATR
jgi:hypothetical protein